MTLDDSETLRDSQAQIPQNCYQILDSHKKVLETN